MKKLTCASCGKDIIKKNETGINKKLLGDKTSVFYCMDCLAEYLGVTVQDIQDKIDEFKEQGCKLFE